MGQFGNRTAPAAAHLTNYAQQVMQFGSNKPYRKEGGGRYNLRHETVFGADTVKTNGAGHVIGMPLLPRKPCFGRPERFIRCTFEIGAEWGPKDDHGNRRRRDTLCDRCPVHSACEKVAIERIESDAAIEREFVNWIESCKGVYGRICYLSGRLKHWNAYLQAIIIHGGWTTINDEQVKLDSLQRLETRKAKAKEGRRAARKRRRNVRQGTGKIITYEFEVALNIERDQRAEKLKRLSQTKTAGPWLSSLKEIGCDRISDVWKSIMWLERSGEKVTGKAIAALMTSQGCDYGLSIPSLTSRVLEDRHRIAKLENDACGEPLWPKWSFNEKHVVGTP